MPVFFDYCLGIGTFVESDVVHHQNRSGWQFGDQIVFEPQIENICVDI